MIELICQTPEQPLHCSICAMEPTTGHLLHLLPGRRNGANGPRDCPDRQPEVQRFTADPSAFSQILSVHPTR